MKVTPEMYTTLFNAITDATNAIVKALSILVDAQQKAEEIYIEIDDVDCSDATTKSCV